MIPAVVAGGVAHIAAHCRCRPSCLSPVRPADVTVVTDDGVALAVHVGGYPSEPLPFDVPTPRSEPLAGVRA